MTEPVEDLPTPAEEEPPTPVTGKPWSLLILAGLVGLAVGVLAIGGVWLFTGTGTTVDKRPITAPPKVGEYVPFDQTKLNTTARPEILARMKQQNERSSQRLSEDYGGAGAAVLLYSDQELQQQLTVMIYRAPSAHPLYVPYEDEAFIGLARPSRSAEEYGEVSCAVANDPTPAGQTPPPGSMHVNTCTRTSGQLTVEIRPNGPLADQPAKVAKLVDEVWAAVF
jgi:hypothetical protein